MDELIKFAPNFGIDIDSEEIVKLLPSWKTYILEAKIIDKDTSPKLELRFLIDAHSKEEILRWVDELQNSDKTTYSIYSTGNTTGRYVDFKRRLICQHNTKSKHVRNSSIKSRTYTKNTNCPSKITISLHAIKKRYQGRDREKHALIREMPCEIIYIATHNHATQGADALRFRKVSESVKEQLLNFFANGHSPSSALKSLKMEIQLNNENYEELLADRKYCPTYMDCYSLYRRKFKKKHGVCVANSTDAEFSKENPEEYNVVIEDFVLEEPSNELLQPLCSNEDTSNELIIQQYTECDTFSEHVVVDEGTETEMIEIENSLDISENTDVLANGRELLKNINEIFTQFLEKSPAEVTVGLEHLHQKLEKIKNPSTFALHCITFGTGIRRKKRGNCVYQPTAISKKRISLSDRTCHTDGQLRKTLNNVIQKKDNVKIAYLVEKIKHIQSVDS